jgi:hypothetical protein
LMQSFNNFKSITLRKKKKSVQDLNFYNNQKPSKQP